MASRMLDMSLEDIIREKKKPSQRGGGGGGGGRRTGGGGGRGGNFRSNNNNNNNNSRNRNSGGGEREFRRIRVQTKRNTPPENDDGEAEGVWEHDLFEDGGGSTVRKRITIQTGAKVQVSGLHFEILSDDLKEIFEQVGDVKSAEVIFDDKDYRSTGTGQVIFNRRHDAEEAVRRLDGVEVNGKIIRVRVVPNKPIITSVNGNSNNNNNSISNNNNNNNNSNSNNWTKSSSDGNLVISHSGSGERRVSLRGGITKQNRGTRQFSGGGGPRRRGGGQWAGRSRRSSSSSSSSSSSKDLDAEIENYQTMSDR